MDKLEFRYAVNEMLRTYLTSPYHVYHLGGRGVVKATSIVTIPLPTVIPYYGSKEFNFTVWLGLQLSKDLHYFYQDAVPGYETKIRDWMRLYDVLNNFGEYSRYIKNPFINVGVSIKMTDKGVRNSHPHHAGNGLCALDYKYDIVSEVLNQFCSTVGFSMGKRIYKDGRPLRGGRNPGTLNGVVTIASAALLTNNHGVLRFEPDWETQSDCTCGMSIPHELNTNRCYSCGRAMCFGCTRIHKCKECGHIYCAYCGQDNTFITHKRYLCSGCYYSSDKENLEALVHGFSERSSNA